ncbi:hypothetical protein GGI20_002652 [Coemansia sp. BCRC 34301]|nr:hypothetical protein GGI20_002652 [Coemansia sp. BCRC 34301]
MTVPINDDVFELTVLDGNPSNRANLQFVFFYKTANRDLKDMSQRMRSAFYATMSHYPILSGSLQRHPQGVQIVVNTASHKALQPQYDEYNVTELVADIAAAHYDWATWPEPLLSVCPIRPRTPEDLPLVHVIVTWHPDGLGLLVSIDHSVTDGVGMATLLAQWSALARNACLAHPVDFDHSGIYHDLLLAAQNPENGWFVDFIDSLPLAEPPGLSDNPAICDSDPRAPQQIELALRRNTHVMHVTAEAMQRLAKDNGHQASVICLVYALMWQRYIAALAKGKDVGPDQQCLINVIHSARHVVGRPAYVGNAVCPIYSRSTLASLVDSPISVVANEVGGNMHSVTAPQWLAFAQMLGDPLRLAKFLTVFANPDALQLTVSNISRVPFFHVDFGFGPPSHATIYPMVVPGFAMLLPLDIDGGLRIMWNLPSHVFHLLKNDVELTRYVNILF